MSQQYIAKELTHFTKKHETLCDILKDSVILAGPNIEDSRKGCTCFSIKYKEDISQQAMIEVNKVCFCDIPEGQTDIHKEKYGDFGIAFDKAFIVGQGGIPVHYVPREATINSKWANGVETRASFFDRMTKELYAYFDSLIGESSQEQDVEKKRKYQRLQEFCTIHVNPYYKFFDHTLPDAHIDNYYFEREWCVVGNVKFKLSDIRRVLLPQEDVTRFRNDFPDYKGPIN
jgi:hypothetical protein